MASDQHFSLKCFPKFTGLFLTTLSTSGLMQNVLIQGHGSHNQVKTISYKLFF